MAELAIQAGHPREARTHLSRAVALWTDHLPEPPSVEARAHLGLLDALEGRPASGRRAVQSSLAHATQTGPVSLEARCRIYLARIDVGERRFDDALETLKTLVTGGKTPGPELQAEVHYWRSRALEGRGDRADAKAEQDIARKLIENIGASLPIQYKGSFRSRPDIQLLIN
jgi:hypothetical protein